MILLWLFRLKTNSALPYSPQKKKKWLGGGEFCCHSVKIFDFNVSSMFHHNMKSIQEGKKSQKNAF